jgi:frataxin-like iron-binding protein CyaY
MSEDQDFKKRADAALSLLGRDLAAAADDYGFQNSISGGVIHVDCGVPGGKITITPNIPAQLVTVQVGSKTYKLDWDIVEAAFVHGESGQNLREMIEQALSKQLRQEVSL